MASGSYIRKAWMKNSGMPPAMKDSIVRALRLNVEVTVIAAIFGVSTDTIYGIKARMAKSA